MKAKVLKQYPGLGMEFTLNDRVAAFFPDPNKGKWSRSIVAGCAQLPRGQQLAMHSHDRKIAVAVLVHSVHVIPI